MTKDKIKIPDSWKSGSYQMAMLSARRRLAGKVRGEISPQEAVAMKAHLLPMSRPDYTRWSNTSEHRTRNPRTTKPTTQVSAESQIPTSRHLTSSAHEFLPLSDRAFLHSALDQSISGISMTYDDVGLCSGCFHQRGPHHHYQAPVRVGGGYSIYSHHNPRHNDQLKNVKWDTLQWLSELGKPPQEKRGGFADEYSAQLFQSFINNGGDVEGLKEYLESNFNQAVLTELQESGANVELISEYTELYRQHVKRVLDDNKARQEAIKEELSTLVDVVTWYARISSDTDVHLLVQLLLHGKDDCDVIEFESLGGNMEILEYYAEQINNHRDCDVIIQYFQQQLEKDKIFRTSNLFLEFVKKGGNLDKLQRYISGGDSKMNDDVIEELVSKFNCVEELSEHLEMFLVRFHRRFASALLLQEYIENGGRVSKLKDFVKSGSSKSPDELTERIGEAFKQDPLLQNDLESFPDDREIIEAYVNGGGDFPKLVQAVSDVLGKPTLENYVRRQTDEVNHQYRVRALDNPSSRPRSAPGRISHVLLPTLLGKARADLTYDELIQTDQSLRKNEGRCLFQALNYDDTTKGRHEPHAPHVPHVLPHIPPTNLLSAITGKRRHTLWVPPKPFLIKKSPLLPTRGESPFSRNRIYCIESLSEDRILEVEMRQRRELDVLRRSFMVEQFQKNWKLAITSPRGSVISGDHTNNGGLPITDPSTTNQPINVQLGRLKPRKKDKKSRRDKQREKMKAVKHDDHVSRRESPTYLDIPAPGNVDDKRVIPEITLSHEMEPLSPPQLESATLEKIEINLVMPVDKVELESAGNTAATIQQDKATEIPPNMKQDGLSNKPRIEKFPTSFATAFGPRQATSSYNNFTSLKKIREMRENPVTMVGGLGVVEKLTSKSESHISNTPSKTWDDITKEIQSRKMTAVSRKMSTSSVESTTSDAHGTMVDILKQYCIIREDRIPAYRRVFDKYVIVKSLRDREKNKKGNRWMNSSDSCDNPTQQALDKNLFLLESLGEKIQDLQEKIKVAKYEVMRAVAIAARANYSDVIKEKQLARMTSVFGLKNGESPKDLKDEEILQLLSASMRHKCEAQMEVRHRKVKLVHLRERTKRLLSRQKTIEETCKALVAETEARKAEVRWGRRATFVRKQSFVYQELHRDDVCMDVDDVREALNEVGRRSGGFDRFLLEGIEEVTFRVFCVIAALNERRKDLFSDDESTITAKFRACKDHYSNLLGPDLEALHCDLTAVGISRDQRDLIIKKLSRSGQFDFLSFVTYAPLFVNIHKTIINNPIVQSTT